MSSAQPTPFLGPSSSLDTRAVPHGPPPSVPSAPGAEALSSTAETRLVIEQDQRSGSFIYKTVDPRSHEVLSQYPTEDLLKLRERPDYVPGAVVQQKI